MGPVDAIAVGATVHVDVDGACALAVFRIAKTKQLAGAAITCPEHGWRYDLRAGDCHRPTRRPYRDVSAADCRRIVSVAAVPAAPVRAGS